MATITTNRPTTTLNVATDGRDNLERVYSVADLLAAVAREDLLLVGYPEGAGYDTTGRFVDLRRKRNHSLFGGPYDSTDTLVLTLANGATFELTVKQTAWAEDDDA